MSSIALCMIAPTKQDAEPVVSRYKQYFDDVVVQLAPNCKNFAEARQKAADKVKTDFYMWVDCDDSIQDPEAIKQLVRTMEQEELDAMYLPYEYGYNEQRELIALHWRERIIRKDHPFTWKGVVHETLISDSNPRLGKDDRVIITHAYKNEDQIMVSALRNHKIMEKAVKDGDEDPRLLYYLGRSYFMLKQYEKSAQTLLIYTNVSGWDEQKYDAWMKIADCLILMDEHDKAINALFEAIKLNGDCPDAYIKMGDLYLALEQPKKALSWLKIGLSKPPLETLEIVDPTLYTYRPLISVALAYFQSAKIDDAKKYIDKAAQFQPKNQMFKNAYKAITNAYFEEQTIKWAAKLGELVEKQGKPKPFIEGLPAFIKNDLRLRPLRNKAFPPIKWPEKSIVFYCGEQWEQWGPDTLDKGMGGSEEAIVYLSRELSAQGWKVTIYNERSEEYEDRGFGGLYAPVYKPWETFNPEDEFDVFVAWRNPRMIDQLKIKARVKCVDVHDVPQGIGGFNDKLLASVDKVFVKSEFQREIGNIPKDKAVIISNGIVPEHFDVETDRKPNQVIYASSADRGLDVLVRDIWPKVKEAVPEAELVWAYGWESYDALTKGNTEKGKWKWGMKRDLFNAGVQELGRLSHTELAKKFKESAVWAYPTYFDEISCITAMKAQAAGCKVVTSGRAALQDTVVQHEEHDEDPEVFATRLIEALQSQRNEKELASIAKQVKDQYAWSTVAKQWTEALK